MKEDFVKEVTKDWLINQPNVSQILTEQIIITEGLTTDIMGLNSDGEIVYIAECKGSVDIGELAKGIGQAYQYYYQKTFNKKARDAQVILVVPEDIKDLFNSLKIPEEIKVFLVSEDRNIYERIEKKSGKPIIMLQLPKTFYIRDIELGHIEYLIKLIYKLSIEHKGKIEIKTIEKRVKKERPEIAASGYNHFITLRALGLINYNNNLTPKGYHLLGLIEKSKISFKRQMCDYFYCFIINVMNAILLIAKEKNQNLNSIELSHKEISDKICSFWGQSIRFMYDPRTISTVMRILRELGVINYKGNKIYEFNRLIHYDFLPWGKRQSQLLYK